MYVIKMEADKSLTTTIAASLYQNEVNVDTMLFLVPSAYNGNLLSDFTVRLDYILPDKTGISEALVMEKEQYKGYLQYKLPLNSKFTSLCGEVELWLSFLDLIGGAVLKSGSAYVAVKERKNITELYSEQKREIVDQLSLDMAALKRCKADNLIFDGERKCLQLSADGVPIGDGVAAMVITDGADEIIHFGDGDAVVSDRSQYPPTEDIIEF